MRMQQGGQMRLPSDWIDEVEIKMLPEPYQRFAEIIGVAPTLMLLLEFGGTYHYIPKADNLIRQIRDRKIIAEYNGYNTKLLANRYALSEVQIYNILQEPRNAMLPGQISMFEDMRR